MGQDCFGTKLKNLRRKIAKLSAPMLHDDTFKVIPDHRYAADMSLGVSMGTRCFCWDMFADGKGWKHRCLKKWMSAQWGYSVPQNLLIVLSWRLNIWCKMDLEGYSAKILSFFLKSCTGSRFASGFHTVLLSLVLRKRPSGSKLCCFWWTPR